MDKHWSPLKKSYEANYERYICQICYIQDKFCLHQSVYFCRHVCETLRFKPLLPNVLFSQPPSTNLKTYPSHMFGGERKWVLWPVIFLKFDPGSIKNIHVTPSWQYKKSCFISNNKNLIKKLRNWFPNNKMIIYLLN